MKVMRKFASLISFSLAVTAMLAFAAPAEIEIGEANPATGEVSLRFSPASEALQLYCAKMWADDTAENYTQWRDPIFLMDIPVGTEEVNIVIPKFQAEDKVRFFLADPDLAVVTRPVTVIGGKNANGDFNSAFITGLHPNYNWKYEIIFDVPEFAGNQAWLLCHRDSNHNSNSLIHFNVRPSNDKRIRFGYGKTNSIYSNKTISENVLYQAFINERICVVSNLTEGVQFCVLSGDLSTTDYGQYNLWFGAASGTDGKIWGAGDKCSFARVYSFKAWNGEDELVGDFRPMVTNNITGYFDLVTRKFFQSGETGNRIMEELSPYVASAETQHIDSLVAHLGELVAVSPLVGSGPVECVSESKPFSSVSGPVYGKTAVGIGESVTFSVPAGEFIWANEGRKAAYRVRSAGMRIDTYDKNAGVFIEGTPQGSLRSYTFTRRSMNDGVRVVFLWDAQMIVDAPDGRKAECLHLVEVGVNPETEKTEIGHGLFDTGVHPIPAKTRVFCNLSLCHSNRTPQNNISPCSERRFFGVRDRVASAPDRYSDYVLISREWNAQNKFLGVGMCNYLDGIQYADVKIALGTKEDHRLEIDVNPTFTRVHNFTDGVGYLAELRGYERSSEPLKGTLHIFGQCRTHDQTAPLCVDYNGTRYYSYAIWQDGVSITRDYVPCIDGERKVAFYDRVNGTYIYPIGDKANIVAEFGESTGVNSVYVIGETENGKMASYYDPDGVEPGYYTIATGDSFSFSATKRFVFDHHVVGYRIDTWDDAAGWQKGEVQRSRSVTLNGENTIRRLVWIWRKASGTILYLR